MKKADPVSSKSLYRCLRVLDVFVYLYYSKKDAFCQDFYGYAIHCHPLTLRLVNHKIREVETIL